MTVDLLEPKHTVGKLGEATDVSVNTIRQWYKRSVLTIEAPDVEAEGEGLARQFTGATAIAIGIMGELIAVGADPRAAAKAAMRFAHSGDGSRLPGHLFAEGSTLLMLMPVGDAIGSRIVNITPETPILSVMKKSVCVFVLLDDVVDRVRVRLGLGRDPRVAPKPRAARREG
jgi:hypothetical protein